MQKGTDKIALFDMDGTICDYSGAMRRDLKELASPLEPDTVLDFHDGEPHIEARMKMIKEQVGWWRNLEPIDLGCNIMHAAHKIGFDIHICTKGPRNTTTAWTEKKQWCNEQLDVPHKLHITEDKGVFYGKILVDDYPPYAERWLEWRPRGLVIMPSYDYNADFSHPNVIKATDTNLDEIIDAMRERYNE